MLDEIKKFFISLTTIAVLFYSTGYLVDKSHGRMLGITGVEPPLDYYLFEGGNFFLGTILALYSTIFSPYWYMFPLFFVLLVFIILSNQYDRTKNCSLSCSVISIIFILILTAFAVKFFTLPFVFSDLLLYEPKVPENTDSFTYELRTWIINENPLNEQKLTALYTGLLLCTIFTGTLSWSSIRLWNKAKDRAEQKQTFSLCTESLRILFGIFVIVLLIVCATLILALPINYGILLKSRSYPEVTVSIKNEKVKDAAGNEILTPSFELFADKHPNNKPTLWLLRQNDKEILLYAVYRSKNQEYLFKPVIVKKDAIQKIEIIKNSFIFRIKG
jgi:hypothetical protein